MYYLFPNQTQTPIKKPQSFTIFFKQIINLRQSLSLDSTSLGLKREYNNLHNLLDTKDAYFGTNLQPSITNISLSLSFVLKRPAHLIKQYCVELFNATFKKWI